MNVSRNRLPFALLVVVMIGAGIALLGAQFLALGEATASNIDELERRRTSLTKLKENIVRAAEDGMVALNEIDKHIRS